MTVTEVRFPRLSPIRRPRATSYMLLMLIAFGITVVGTRTFLELTGYPQIGSATLHIAHVLWGGLALFASTIILMIYANRWAYVAGAILSGVGVGLFIDEVGKFITQDNDYFFPFAAPIIYAFFVLTVFLYLRVRRDRRPDARQEIHAALDTMHEVLENDLDSTEREQLINSLKLAKLTAESDALRGLAEDLLLVAESSKLPVKDPAPAWWKRLTTQIMQLEQRFVGRRLHKFALIVAYLAFAFGTLAEVVLTALIVSQRDAIAALEALYYQQAVDMESASFGWVMAHSALSTILFGTYFVTALGLLVGRDESSTRLGAVSLFVALTFVHLLTFYLNQFAAVSGVILSLLLLLATLRYRQRFLASKDPRDPIPTE